ncbi:Protein kinase-like domain protein [Niveomyces insectorum RCEF 264]|uniref:EKC/KEOPS complex subunit BUD32 n=1 Tax=Niveomyces insectorum RCEF 264 TaxID=1081102 RepID=A0A167SDT8_9HYPO|nr:Protein kinase-like domain protein [Niveomyces insectorum RCEF 264]
MSSKTTPSRSPELGDDSEDDGLPDDVSIKYDGVLDHAPAVSNGTYLDGINDGLEPLDEYREGGYHPVHLGDTLGALGRYRVLHKLGHGGFGTVWLCRDTRDAGYVAVKVMVGDHLAPETSPDLTLMQLDRSAPGAEHIAIPQDSFTVKGPNGSHQCIVLPVLGPCVSPRLWLRMKNDPGPVLRRMAQQTAQAMQFLHGHGICHGDFRPSNILVKPADLNKLPENELLALLGQPEKASVRTESGADLPASSPQYLIHAADLSRLGDEYLTDNICVIDFGESFPLSSPPADLGMPENYLPPEVLLDVENPIGPACDLWALGCTVFEIRQQIPLFYMIFDTDELLAEMVRFFGMLPQGWWDQWEAREDYFDQKGAWLRGEDDGEIKEEWSLEVALSKPLEVVDPGRDGGVIQRALITPEAEQKLMADLLYKLFRYEPEKRLRAEDVVAHAWFQM